MKRILVVMLGLALLASVVGLANTTLVVPRVYNVLLFDNASGADATKLGIIFDRPVSFTKDNIIVFGGGAVGAVAVFDTYAFISVRVVKGGTLQLVLPPAYAGAIVSKAYWFE